jgi:signal transduction histidine kinase/CheY-like chemotaxis protein
VLAEGDTVLASAHGSQSAAPVPAGQDRDGIEGRVFRILRSEVPVHPGTHWQMVLAIPEQDLLAATQTWILLLTAVVFILLVIPLLWGLRAGRILSAEAQILAKAAQSLGAGEPPELPIQRVSEFRTVGQALTRAHAEIQDRIRLQQRLQHSQRIETLGTLAGGIAHDVNNHLSAIMGQIFLARETLPEGHPSGQRLVQAEAAAQRCARVTRALLTFSRQEKPDLAPLDLNDLVARTAEVLERVLGGMVRVRLELGSDLPRILGERVQLEQVIMNLAINARDSMPEGGTVTFVTRLDRAHSVQLCVTDTGTGIPPEQLPHIFEPFFTTKPVGQGTGLGLAMVFGIMKSHGGHLEVESTVGVGTTFTLAFPPLASAGSGAAELPATQELKGPLQGFAVLVAEDEAYLKETLEDAISIAGAVVVSAATGDEAWQRFQEQSFDCVLSDQRMPGCTGLELLRRIRAAGSPVPFILASGQDLDPFNAEAAADPRVRLLAKPFSVTRLIAMMDELGLRNP